jgi:hypothetical protein
MSTLKPIYQLPCGFMLALLIGCNNGPKVIEVTDQDRAGGTFAINPEIQVAPSVSPTFNTDLHQVVAEEVMQGTRYVFVKVREGNASRWVATRKLEVKQGETYYYRGGLLKTNFESQEFSKKFDTIYLISSLVASDHARQAGGAADIPPKAQNTASQPQKISMHGESVTAPQGTLSIAELVKNASKYAGQTVQIHGTCVKINPNIMQRNWIHVQDGSQDDYDLVITSVQYLAEGTEFTMSATVTLKKDFGAGYYYDLILENGVLVE